MRALAKKLIVAMDTSSSSSSSDSSDDCREEQVLCADPEPQPKRVRFAVDEPRVEPKSGQDTPSGDDDNRQRRDSVYVDALEQPDEQQLTSDEEDEFEEAPELDTAVCEPDSRHQSPERADAPDTDAERQGYRATCGHGKWHQKCNTAAPYWFGIRHGSVRYPQREARRPPDRLGFGQQVFGLETHLAVGESESAADHCC